MRTESFLYKCRLSKLLWDKKLSVWVIISIYVYRQHFIVTMKYRKHRILSLFSPFILNVVFNIPNKFASPPCLYYIILCSIPGWGWRYSLLSKVLQEQQRVRSQGSHSKHIHVNKYKEYRRYRENSNL